MRRLAWLSAFVLLACGSDPPAKSPEAARATDGPEAGGEPRVALTPQELRAKWEPLAKSEGELASGVSSLATLGAEEKLRRLSSLRADAGMIEAGLTRIEPPPELAACKKTALAGVKQVRSSLDAIHEMWMGRAAKDRATADRISVDLCGGFAALREGREACGVAGAVAQPLACK
jgi:hypothetical protein